MTNFVLNLISDHEAKLLNKLILGTPSEDRILIIRPSDESKTSSGLYIPTNAEDEVPKKGVVIKFGPVTEAYSKTAYLPNFNVGSVVTFGKYAGKEIQPNFSEEPGGINLDNQKFSILSLSEVLYIEPNANK